MRRFLMTVAIAATTLGTVQMAAAQTRPDGPPPACRQDDKKCPNPAQGEHRREGRPGDDRRAAPPECRQRERNCPKPPQGEQREGRRGQPHGAEPRHERVAQKHEGRVFRPGRDSHLGNAPRGTEYRVIDDRLVLVNKQNHKILRVIGPAPRQ